MSLRRSLSALAAFVLLVTGLAALEAPAHAQPNPGYTGDLFVGATITRTAGTSIAFFTDSGCATQITSTLASSFVLEPTTEGLYMRVVQSNARAHLEKTLPTYPCVGPIGALRTFTIGDPVITGTAKFGNDLTCAAPELPLGAQASFVWYRVINNVEYDTSVAGDTLTLDDPDYVGESIRCRVTAVRPEWANATSDATVGPVELGDAPVDPPTITGDARVGSELTCAAPDNLPQPNSVDYEWYVDHDPDNLRSRQTTYTVQPDDAGLVVTCAISVTLVGYNKANATADTDPVALATWTPPPPIVHGDGVYGQTLTCEPPEAPWATVDYYWEADGVPVSDNFSSHEITVDDIGKVLTCVLFVTRVGYEDAMSSTDVGPVTPVPAGTYTVTVSGNPRVGNTLRAKVDPVPEGLGANVMWQWYRGKKPVAGANTARYDLGFADYGYRMRAVATVLLTGHVDATASGATDQVDLKALQLDLSTTKAKASGVIHITITNLVPGEPWSFGFRQSAWGISGKGLADGSPIVRRVQLPDDITRLGDRQMIVTTHNPDRQAVANITILP